MAVYREPPAYCTGFYYTLRAGDTLANVASRNGIALQQLLAANPQITNPNLIYTGQTVCVPRTGMPGYPGRPPVMPGPRYHVVAPGETLAGIARMYGVTVENILLHNPEITDPSRIYVGQRILIPGPGLHPGPGPGPGAFYHTVAAGENLAQIATRYGVSVDAILRANPQIVNPDLIYVGQRILIPRAGLRGKSYRR